MKIACQRFLVKVFDSEPISSTELSNTITLKEEFQVLKGDSSLEDEQEIAGLGNIDSDIPQ